MKQRAISPLIKMLFFLNFLSISGFFSAFPFFILTRIRTFTLTCVRNVFEVNPQ